MAGLLGASFANKVSDLIVTQGVIFGLGIALLYNPFVFYLDDWFDKRMGFAYGCLWAGTGLGGLVTPLLMGWCLNTYGFRTSLRVWAVVMVVFILPFILTIRPRLAANVSQRQPWKPQLAFWVSLAFWILLLANIIEGLGYFMPSIFLPSTLRSPIPTSPTESDCVTNSVCQLSGRLTYRIKRH